MVERAKSVMSEWECRKCGKAVTMHVAGTGNVSHRCPQTMEAQPFKRTWQSKYNAMR